MGRWVCSIDCITPSQGLRSEAFPPSTTQFSIPGLCSRPFLHYSVRFSSHVILPLGHCYLKQLENFSIQRR